MAIKSFVDTLDLAGDDRLRALRPAPEATPRFDLRRGDGSRAPAASGPPPRAAVNGGAVLSFVAGLSGEETTDVLYSTQLAQRAASARHDRFAATEAWYGLYTEMLTRLGWIGEAFAFTRRDKTAGSYTLDRSALDVIMTIATGNQLAILVKTLTTLQGLADNGGAVRVFELQALTEQSGNFQLGSVQRAENGALSLALGAFHFHSSDRRRWSLFVAWGNETISFWAGAQKLTLNRDLYAQHRAAVAQRLEADAADYIAAIEIV
jgi:hypothetical protein